MTNRWLKLLSIFVSLVLIINLLPLQALASDIDETPQLPLSTLPEDSSSGSTTGYQRLDTATVVEEDTSRRGEYYKEFVLNNGLRLAAVYADPVHFEEDGQWKDIDNTLKAVNIKGVSGYTNTAGVWQVHFPQQLTGSNAISVTKDGYTVSFGMAGELTNSGNIAVASIGASSDILAVSSVRSSAAQIRAVDLTEQKAAAQYEQTVLEKHHSQLAYSSVYDNTEVVYDLTGSRLKESIVISKYDTSLWGYRYNLNTGGLIPVLLEDNTIELRHPETAEVVMTMPAPFMVDANDEYSYDVDVSLVQKSGGYLLSYYVPRAWLASSDRAWPVVLDPVIDGGNTVGNIQDITASTIGTHGNSDQQLLVGKSTANGVSRIYFRHNTLPELPSASVIIKATIALKKVADSEDSLLVEVHKSSRYWTPTTINNGDRPTPVSTVEDVVKVQAAGVYTWDITNIVSGWYSSTTHSLTNNIGLIFKASAADEGSDENNVHAFYSSDNEISDADIPQTTIIYQETAGLEDYWDYTPVSAGRAGTGYIHNHSGNLVWVHNDMGFDGNRMPVSISHIFNSRDSSSNVMGLGYGWRTNYNQLLNYQLNTTNNTRYYIWEDGDGTDHYFYEITTEKYRDEDGLELTLNVLSTDSGYTEQKYSITDKLGNKSYFDSWGRLTSQVSNQRVNLDDDSTTSSVIRIVYVDTSNSITRRISSITDGAGRVYAFSYNSDSLLNRIDYLGTSENQTHYSLSFTYDNGLLTGVSYLDGKPVSFTYASKNLLSTVTDVDGYKLTFAYNTTGVGKPSRIKSVSESHGSTNGDTTNFSYGYYNTKITTQESTRVHFFNQWSNTISVQDDQGRGIFQEYTPVLAQGDYKNQLIKASAQQVTVGNMLLDSSFEYNTLWTNAGCSDLSISSPTAYIGAQSMSFKNGGVQTGPFEVKNGESITFSAYLKSDNLPGVELELKTASTSLAKSSPLSDSDDWERLSVAYTNDSGATQTVYPKISMNSTSTVYVDCVQLEKDANANAYNLIQNGDFSNSSLTYWLTNGSGSVVTNQSAAAPSLCGGALKLTGGIDQSHTVFQTISVSGNQEDSFVISGWAKGDCLPPTGESDDSRVFALQVVFLDSFGNIITKNEDIVINFNPHNADQWQYAAKEIRAPRNYSEIMVAAIYNKNIGTAYFDGIGLYKGRLGDSYTYENGNLSKHKDVQGNITTYNYAPNGVDVSSIVLPTGTTMAYTYENGTHNVLTAQEYVFTGNDYVPKSTITYTYDNFGNVTATSYVTNEDAESITQTTSAVYTEDKNHLAEYTNETGETTKYGYYPHTGLLQWVQYPGDTAATRTEYEYDIMLRPVKTAATTDTGKNMSVEYAYTNDRIATIKSPKTEYTMTYGLFGQRTSVSIGTRQLAQYTYREDCANRYLEELAYGNDDVVKYEYDTKGRVIEEKYENSDGTGHTVTYTYNFRGLMATKHDTATDITTKYVYDAQDRLIHVYDTGNRTSVYDYDTLGNVTLTAEKIGNYIPVSEYNYDEQNRPSGIIEGDIYAHFYYDALNRKTGQSVYKYNAITGLDGVSTDSSITYYEGSDRVHILTVGGMTYTYSYDAKGNIKSVVGGGNNVSYQYDSQNQLIRENNQAAGKTWTWEYDNAGNIVYKREYAYTTGTLGSVPSTVAYGYPSATNSETWKDLLLSYNGSAITYDTIGNPLSDGTWSYEWKQGRQLAKMSGSNGIWNFAYDDTGLRTLRTNGIKTYNYVYSGSLLRQMTVDGYSFIFRYGVDGRPYSVRFNNTDYFYVLNLQGDVIGIRNKNGTTVVSYSYDAWGNILGTTGSMATTLGALNPLRYRGYVYDQETGLYYLQTRYYNPQWGRFINADSVMSGIGDSILGNNQFVYCFNNPVNLTDSSGNWPQWIKDAVGWVNDNIIQPVIRFGRNVITDVENYETGNTSEQVVFDSHYFSCYKGVLVIKMPIDASFSFVIIGLSTSQQNPDTLKHEYGHTVQLGKMGLMKYIKEVAIPSLTLNVLDRKGKLPYDYFSYPWEAEANELGGSNLTQDGPALPEDGYNSYWDLIFLFFD